MVQSFSWQLPASVTILNRLPSWRWLIIMKSSMPTITLTSGHLSAYTDGECRTYVRHTGSIVSVSDNVDLQRDTKPLNDGTDAVELEG